MEPIAMILVAGMAGGLLISVLVRVAGRLQPVRRTFDAFAEGREPRKTDVINIASIRVSGVGGLGLVAMALALAWSIPRIGQTITFGAILGAALAALLIWRRRRSGPLPTSSASPGANTTLSIDEPARPGVARPTVSDDRTADKVRLSLVHR
jgi:short subunit fatty acids transporter